MIQRFTSLAVLAALAGTLAGTALSAHAQVQPQAQPAAVPDLYAANAALLDDLSERTFRCDQCDLVLDRDLNAARNLAALVEVTTSSPSCGATRNEPDGNPRKTTACGAAGTATGRPFGSTSAR